MSECKVNDLNQFRKFSDKILRNIGISLTNYNDARFISLTIFLPSGVYANSMFAL